MNLKLALVTGEFPPQQGGVGDYTRELAREFARRGLDVTVITDRRVNREQSAVNSSANYELRITNYASWGSLEAVHRLAQGCDLVHIQYQAAAYGMTPPIHLLPRYLHWKKFQRKVIVTFHDLRIPYLFPRAGRLRQRAVTCLAQSCDAVVVTNQEDLQALQTQIANSHPERHWYNAAEGRKSQIVLIPIGSNIDAQALAQVDRAAPRASLGVKSDETLLCYFGFLNASKGGETLVRVLANVIRAGYNARLLMLGGEVGASDPTNIAYAQKVKALIGELGLGERVVWAGYRPVGEVTALWRASDIAVLPYADGASLRRGTLMAALAHALPIVSTMPRVPVPQLHDGENIALAPPNDAEALAAQVIALIESPALRERLAQGAAQLAQEFSWPRIADQHLELYRSLITVH